MRPSLADRIAVKTIKTGPEECWLWRGAKKPCTTPGVFRATISVRNKTRTTARVIWELQNGPIPDGMWVLHRCDNTMCVNLDHFYLGKMANNISDRTFRERSAKIDSALAIKIVATQDALKNKRAVARTLGVRYSIVRDVLRGRSWSWATRLKNSTNPPNGHVL